MTDRVGGYVSPELLKEMLDHLRDQAHTSYMHIPTKEMGSKMDFEKELAALLNKHNWDGRTNTPDFILAFLLVGILERYDTTMYRRNLRFTHPESGEQAKLDGNVSDIKRQVT